MLTQKDLLKIFLGVTLLSVVACSSPVAEDPQTTRAEETVRQELALTESLLQQQSETCASVESGSPVELVCIKIIGDLKLKIDLLKLELLEIQQQKNKW